MTSHNKKNELNRANAKFSNDSITSDIPNEFFDKNNQPTSVMPPIPPPIGADKLSQFGFDNIIEGMAHASAKPIEINDIQLDEIHPDKNNRNFTEENPSLLATPTTMSSVSEQQTEEVQQPTSNESATQGLATLMINSIMTGFNPSQVKDVKTKGSIYELFGEPITQETFTYGIGIINTNTVKKIEPELIRHYFLYKQPASQGIFNKTEHQPKIFRVEMGQQSFKNINDVFVGKLKTNKLIENYLTKKYVK